MGGAPRPPSPWELNDLGQPVGPRVDGWREPSWPSDAPMAGRFCRLERVDPDLHAADLYAAQLLDPEGRNWTYMGYGPFTSEAEHRAWVEWCASGRDPLFFAIVDLRTGRAGGVAAYLRIDPPMGVVEVGHLNYTPLLQRHPAATEAMYLMMRRVFDEHGYRRYEWKCNSLNAASWRAAERLGFTFEGVFRQHWVTKGRNRDTAWLAVLDTDWPVARAAFEAWLAPGNFDAEGRQLRSLEQCRAVVAAAIEGS